ncbi:MULTISPECIES: DUF6544 family protein [Actinosynnema]|uniref:DUF6544 family protein n=1 Tax=Actinosynnema TaxID=40566 RepID=UPI0020A481DD|nr:DUF6544 family protein [Actinosynnema pretiosum]MCP2099113.1 hypothetical protein [Actinosynnema pretiosum]
MQSTATQPAVTAADIAHLPEPAQRYLEFTGVLGRPLDIGFEAHLNGWSRQRPDQHWTPCRTHQRASAEDLSRVVENRVGRLVQTTDVLRDGHVERRSTALRVFTVARESGPEHESNELVAFLCDAVLLAPSVLLSLDVLWKPVSDEAFDLVLTGDGRSVRARVVVDERGAVRELTSNDRFAELPEGLARTRWSAAVDDGWFLDSDRMRPRRVLSVWHLPSGEFAYAHYDLTRCEVVCTPGEGRRIPRPRVGD